MFFQLFFNLFKSNPYLGQILLPILEALNFSSSSAMGWFFARRHAVRNLGIFISLDEVVFNESWKVWIFPFEHGIKHFKPQMPPLLLMPSWEDIVINSMVQ